ncbi:MAG TPA: GNAT family N-acetyltransferase [Pyrinomonadaceae bacterium]|jgi:GNAT superfamily N-acetyltransferase
MTFWAILQSVWTKIGIVTDSMALVHYAVPRATVDIDFVVNILPENVDKFIAVFNLLNNQTILKIDCVVLKENEFDTNACRYCFATESFVRKRIQKTALLSHLRRAFARRFFQRIILNFIATKMRIVEQTELSADQKARILELWNNEYPENLAFSNVSGFEAYLSERGNGKHFLLIDSAEKIIGWALIFDRDNARWFSIIVDGKMHGQGWGTRLIDKLKAAERRLFGWVIDNSNSQKSNGEVYESPLGFYKKLGFRVHENDRIEKKGILGVKIEWNALNQLV